MSEVYPPLNNSIMFPTENLTINITSAGNYAYAFKSGGGLVAINEIFPVYMYNRFYAISASQITPISTNRFQIPFAGLQPGREYELSIYSRTFVAETTHYLFGDLEAGARPYRYRFRVFDFAVGNIGTILSTTTQLVLTGENFTSYTPEVLIGGYKLTYVTANLTFKLGLKDSDCANIAPTGNLTSYSQTQLVISGLDFHGCTEGTLLLTLNISRECTCVSPVGCQCSNVGVASRADELSFFYKGGNMLHQPIGHLGCDSACLTCYGTTATSCSLCKAYGPLPYLAGGACLSSCPSSLPINYNTTAIYKGTTVLSLTCMTECPTGMYVNSGRCTLCYSNCMRCSGPSMSECTKCYTGMYLLDGVCVNACPTEQFDSAGNCVKFTMNVADAISINAVGTSNRYITGLEDVHLKMVKNSPYIAVQSTIWKRIPPLGSTEERLFQNDTDTNSTTAMIRKEYIKRMTIGETLLISVTAKICNITNSSIKGTASDSVVLIRKSAMVSGVTTATPMEGMAESTEFSVVLTNWTLETGTVVEIWVTYEGTASTLVMQRQVEASDSIGIGAVKFPSWGLVSAPETKPCMITVTATKLNEKVWGNVSVSITNNLTSAAAAEKLETFAGLIVASDDSAIRASSIISSISRDSSQTFSPACNSEADCSYHGECNKASGIGECVCDLGWNGNRCAYAVAMLEKAANISAKLNAYINSEFLSSTRSITPTELSAFSTIIGNLGQTPELISNLDTIASYLQRGEKALSWENVSAMGEENLGNYIRAAVTVLSIENAEFKAELNENSKINTSMPTMDQYYARANMSKQFGGMKGAVYGMLDKAAMGLQTEDSLSVESDTFEAVVDVFYTNNYINASSSASFSTSSASVTVPLSVFKTGPVDLQENNTASVRMLRWNGNPYTFAKSAKLVRSDVVSFSFVNSSGGEMEISGLTEPIAVKITVPGQLAGRTDLLCVYFDENAEETVTYQDYEEINVNTLNMTDAEKTRTYPEWKASLYKTNPLIVKKLVTKNITQKIGDFSTSGCQLTRVDGTTVTCLCNHLSDFAVKLNISDTATGPTIVEIPYTLPEIIKQVLFAAGSLCLVELVQDYRIHRVSDLYRPLYDDCGNDYDSGAYLPQRQRTGRGLNGEIHKSRRWRHGPRHEHPTSSASSSNAACRGAANSQSRARSSPSRRPGNAAAEQKCACLHGRYRQLPK